MNKTIFKTLSIALLAVVFASCEDQMTQKQGNQSLLVRATDSIDVIYPDGVKILSKQAETLTFVNRSTGDTTTVKRGATVVLLDGLYDCNYAAHITYDNEGTTVEGNLYGSATSVKISGVPHFSITAYLFASKDDFIIEEIFFTGTLQPSGKQYNGDNFVKIYNNTDHVLYADGIALVESKFTSTQKWDYTPDIQNDTMTIQALYVVPGSGKDHPVQPGESFILCDVGIDHRTANPNSFDLSRADYEWYDISSSPSNMDIDSETVPNLDKWYCYTLSFWILHNRGFKSYALARIPIDKETYLANYLYTYQYTMHLAAGDFPMEQTAYKLPNAWIVDGVNCSVEAVREWNILPPSIDAGWTHCGTIDKDATRYFKSVRRKMLYLTDDGRRVLKDTNNSSADFNGECTPSIVEEQKTAIDANGTTATQRTYDGVWVMETEE